MIAQRWNRSIACFALLEIRSANGQYCSTDLHASRLLVSGIEILAIAQASKARLSLTVSVNYIEVHYK